MFFCNNDFDLYTDNNTVKMMMVMFLKYVLHCNQILGPLPDESFEVYAASNLHKRRNRCPTCLPEEEYQMLATSQG